MPTRITHELLVVSDIHLISRDEFRGRLLLDFLSKIDTSQVRYLVLLGDIFDFCFGASSYFKEKFEEFGKSLSRLAHESVGVYFFEGNHEFLLQHLPWKGVHFLRNESLKLKMSDAKQFAFIHGDYIAAPWHYHLYSQGIRSNLSRICASLLPQKALDQIALGISAKSRKRSYTKHIDHKQITFNIANWLIEQGADYGIVGHFHVPYDVTLENKKGRLLCLESWDTPNFLSYDHGKFYRNYLKDDEIKVVDIE